MRSPISVPFVLAAGWFSVFQPEPIRVAPPILVPPTMTLEEARDSIVAFEARRFGMPVAMALAITHVENWSGDSTAANARSGALGIMQIMPQIWSNAFQHDCYGDRALVDRHRNACLGVQIALLYYGQTGNWDDALRRYAGAVTPSRGDRYVSSVMKQLDLALD